MQRSGGRASRPNLGGTTVDRLTQRWVMATGRQVTFEDATWLDGPVGAPTGIGTDWIAQHAHRTATKLTEDEGGLLPDMAALNGPGFDVATIHPHIRAF